MLPWLSGLDIDARSDSFDMYNSIGKNLILNPYNIVLPDDTRLFQADRKSDLVRGVAGNDSKVIIAVAVERSDWSESRGDGDGDSNEGRARGG